MTSLKSTRIPGHYGFILDVGDVLEKGDAHSWSRLDEEERLPKDGEESVTIRVLWMMFWTLTLLLSIGAASVGPSLATIMLGNVICEAANLPHYTKLEVPLRVGAIGGAVSFIVIVFLAGIMVELCRTLDARFAAYYRSTGKLSFDIDRRDGHFPVLIIWIPFIFFFECLVANLCGSRWQSQLTVGQVGQMAAIGGLIVTPAVLIIGILSWIVLERLFNLEKAKTRGYTPPSEAILFVKRQWEALGWLISIRRHTNTTMHQVDHEDI